MAAEADQCNRAKHCEARDGRAEQPCALAPASRREHEERQHQPGGDLHSDTGCECRRTAAEVRVGAGREHERGGERKQDQRVVVRASDSEHEQYRVQPDERARPAPRLAEAAGGAGDQRDRSEAAEHRDRLERPQRATDAERYRRVAQQREQRSIRRVLERPAEKREDFVAGRLRGDMCIRIEPVQRAHPCEADVAEDILREQRWAEQQDHMRRDDRRGDRAQRQRAREQEHEHVAGAHDQRQRLEATRSERQVQRFERLRDPRRPAAAATWHVLRRFAGGAG
jgi:hypothetical protein